MALPIQGSPHEMRRMQVGAAILLSVVCIGMAVALFLVSRAIDEHALDDEQALVERRITRSLDMIASDITSASIWGEAVEAVARRDQDWMQLNFGDYYADYMDHAVSLVFDGEGQLLQASRDSETVSAASEAPFIAAVGPMVAGVRSDADDPGRRAAIGFAAVSTRQSAMRIDGEIYLVGAATIVPEDGVVIDRPDHDAMVISAKPVQSLIESMGLDLGLPNAALTALDAPHLAVLRTADGQPLAGLNWTPSRPGSEVLSKLVPVFAGLLAAFLAVCALMWRRIVANVRRLSDSEIALGSALEAAEGANVAKTRFLANMSHELRTPLNGVLGMAEVLSMSGLTNPQHAQVATIRKSGEHLLTMIERILEMAHIDSAMSPPDRAPFEPADVFSRVSDSLRPKAASKGLSLSDGLDPVGRRLGDAKRLTKALHVFVDNAIQFTAQGSVRLELRQEGNDVVFTVADTGIGMTDQVQARLFKPFSQGDDSATRSVDGAGLGLALAQRLIASMSGRIDYDTRVGSGTTFRITLPLPHAEEALPVARPLAA